ncbi:M56 family metallopeptidase [Fulvivirga sedimenti]|uniref:M48 family metalloprotease n=1 Tax=Fulvivirga sedimenti TaxID=2879465 RepID=A0A9X1KZ59_9BACT|nr:M56 family metallopeptidase [Fulvivirga sedimenti]MCA6075537.1 M48 family metalloprotease [Fulvivirga sedimenti]MCA6076714.1 M48 family metalloprotease [Fulvivirga sedimenti]MCA6077842.1 M48 family metalloprotease [Fulvivirga sedimenti]
MIPEMYKEAVGMALLHSLWQGAIWSMALLMIRQLFKDAHRRYLGGLIAFGGFFISVAVTTFIIWPTVSLQAADESMDILLLAGSAVPAESILTDFRTLMPWFINFWLVGTSLFVLRMIAGFHYLGRLTALSNTDVPSVWEDKIHRMATDLGITRRIRVLNSAHVDMPMIYGHIRPVLLLPVTLLSGLSATQLEAIFAHELAHIRRHDYLVNIIQRSLEAIFFFNPFVWWISKSINNERERCCDDLAVDFCSDRRLYVEALSSLETYRLAGTGLAMGLGSDKSDLLHRIRRLLEPDYRQGGNYKLVVMAIIFTVGLIGFNFISVKPGDDQAQAQKVTAGILSQSVSRSILSDTTKPASKINRVKVPAQTTMPNVVAVNSLDTLDLDIDLSGFAEIDFDPIMTASMDAMANMDITLSGVAEINIEKAFEVIEDLDMNVLTGSVQVALDTNILRRDTTWTRLNDRQREELRRAREEIRRAQLELREVSREQMMEMREQLLEQREQMREEWERVREQVREEFEKNGGKLSDEERLRIRQEMEIAQKQLAQEMEITQKQIAQEMEMVQKQLAQQMEIREKMMARELEMAEKEMERAQVEMDRHNQFQSMIERMLRNDNYLKNGEKLNKLKVSKDSFRFNGKKVSDQDLDRYLKVFQEYFGSIGSGTYEYND